VSNLAGFDFGSIDCIVLVMPWSILHKGNQFVKDAPAVEVLIHPSIGTEPSHILTSLLPPML